VNKHSNTDPDVIAVTVMLTKLPTAVETTGIAWRTAPDDLALRARAFPDRFLAAIVILGEGHAA
jgi:hypothetical protein